MRRPIVLALVVTGSLQAVSALSALSAAPAAVQAQTPKPPDRRPASAAVIPASVPRITVAPDVTCPTPLGAGVASKLMFCDVLSGRNPADGVLIQLPPHRGPVTLTFDLHNRHTYSEEQIKANRAFARYTATIGVLTMDNTLVKRAAVQNEFRTVADLVDRIGGGAGPGGLKAVAPTGTEHITVIIPQEEAQVSLLGEKLTVERADAAPATYTSPGRPIAIVSNVMIEYVAPLAPKPPARKK
jgi:hypothetical protein